jgi:hypothetical protein
MKKTIAAAFPNPTRALAATFSAVILLSSILVYLIPVPALGDTASFSYTFNSDGTLYEAGSPALSTSPYFWLKTGGKLVISNGLGRSIAGNLSATDPLHIQYAKTLATASDNGYHPQNVFFLLTKSSFANTSAQIYLNRVRDNLANSANQHPYNGESILARYTDANNYYYAGLRADGTVVIKKKVAGVYTTLATGPLFSGTYSSAMPNLIPLTTWIGLRFEVTDVSGGVALKLYTDVGKTGTWKLAASGIDATTTLQTPGVVGIESDYADLRMDNLTITGTSGVTAPPPPPPTNYDQAVLAGNPALYLTMASPASGKEIDQSGHNINGNYIGGTPTLAALPNGDQAAVFNGSNQYLTVPSHPTLSIPTTHQLTWEAWVRPDTFAFANASDDGYVDWMGKCENYSPDCEWEARVYGDITLENRPDRFSAYVFNPNAGLGSAADWQPSSGLFQAEHWIHVVAEYDTTATPSECNAAYPGTINIWVDGVKQSFVDHAPTGCMSQYKVIPKAGNSPLDIGTMAMDTWFKGAIGKVAVYDRLLSQSEIDSHFKAMTGVSPAGSCGTLCSLINLL